VYDPALVGHGTGFQILRAMATAACGIILLSSGFEGYTFFLKRISWPVRILFMAAGLLVFSPNRMTDLVGLGLLILGILIHFFGKSFTGNKAVEKVSR
jgi:TRAP-type uncharacterized transport system fused permease subunit